MEGYYFLTQAVGRWFMVEQKHRADWDNWISDPGSEALRLPAYAKPIAGPKDLLFKEPLERQYGDRRLHFGEWA